MNIPVKSKRSKLFISMLSSIMSMLFFISPPFERNPQACEMIRVIGKKEQK